MAPPVRVSVVVPHLNEPDDLQRCLAALEAQRGDGVPFEVIVADNGSVHPPDDVVARFPGTRMTVEPRPGPGPARNLGASVAVGDIVAFVDCDCLVQPGWLRTVTDFLDGNPDVAFVAGSIGIATAATDRMTSVEAYEAVFSYRVAMFVRRDRFAATGNMAVRRSVFLEVGPFDGVGTHEDIRWGHRAVGLGHRLAYLPGARVLTPACACHAGMRERIDRHVAHSVADLRPGIGPRLMWLLTAGAMLASPLAGIPEIMRSRDVVRLPDRLRAFGCLVRVRWYRGWRMVIGLRRTVTDRTIASWNREPPAGQEEV